MCLSRVETVFIGSDLFGSDLFGSVISGSGCFGRNFLDPIGNKFLV